MIQKLIFSVLLFFPLCLKAEDIYIWHAFEGFLEERFRDMIEDFNSQSTSHKVIPVYKGNYTEVYSQGIEAMDEGKHPHILQVYEVATLSMSLQHGRYISAEELMKKYVNDFDSSVFIDSARLFYSNEKGEMLSFPWNASTGVLFYNKDAFREAGLDPESPPLTWNEFEEMGEKLQQVGYQGFTTAWPAAYHLEHFSAWHNIPFSTEKNGFGGLAARLNFDQSEQIYHLEKLADWQQKGLFSYSGRFCVEPEKKFADQKCAILLQGANRLPLLERACDFEIGVGYMPYWPHLIERPQNLGIGGSSFWVLEGFEEKEYKAIAEFFEYLTLPSVQSQWHEQTGYLPISDAAYQLTESKGFYKDHPAAEIAALEVMENEPTPHSYGVRLGNYIEIRELIIDYIEKALEGDLTAEEALHEAVRDGNHYLEAFQGSNG